MQKQILSISQKQRLSPVQFQTIRMLGYSTQELQEAILREIEENPVLEENWKSSSDQDLPETNEEENYSPDMPENNDDLDIMEQDSYGNLSDSYSIINSHSGEKNPLYAEQVISHEESYLDNIKAQIDESGADHKTKQLSLYLAGMLDDSGYLDRGLQTISDDLAFSTGINVSEKELQKALSLLQSFDPAGIGARNLQESLTLQIKRQPKTEINALSKKILEEFFELFSQKKYATISKKLGITNKTIFEEAIKEILRLSPKPLMHTEQDMPQHVFADFVVEQYNGSLYVSLTRGNYPSLSVSMAYKAMLKDLSTKTKKTKDDREAIKFTQQKISGAETFIEAINQRNQTLLKTMIAIANHQKQFFLTGDASSLLPMRLKDLSETVGYDQSTISRSTSGKYVDTEFGVFPLRYFFSEGIQTEGNEEVSNHKIKSLIEELLEKEDKQTPLTDEELTKIIANEGYKIARRTVAKYRKLLGILPASQRYKQ